jgi:hypothetical protein
MYKQSARFSKQAYNMVKSGNKTKRLKKINDSISDTGFVAHDKYSNRDILYLTNDKTKEVHIANRGTDTSGKMTKTDIRQDLAFAFGQSAHDKATKKNVKRIKKLVKSTPEDYTITMSGHSLGNVAPTEALKSSAEVRRRVSSFDSFNGAHSPFTSKAPSKAVQKELKEKITNHRIVGDAVSSASNANSVGKVVEYEGRDMKHLKHVPKFLEPVISTVQQLKIHSIDNFIEDKHLD